MKKYIDKFKALEKGQKIKLIAVLILLLIVLYLIIGMFSGNSDNYAVNTNNKPAAPVIHKKLTANVVEKHKIAKPQRVTHTLNKKQKAYLKSVNELQMLQLQQQIAKSKQQIAAAELQIAQSNQKRQSIVAPPPPPTVIQQLKTQQTAANKPVARPVTHYEVKYIANESGKWQVILSDNGKLVNATMGTVLADGSKLTKITGTSVTLSNGNHQKVLTINSGY